MSRDLHLDLLDRIHIASPCPMRWEDLEGDGSTRHCDRCNLDVHNLTEMTRDQVVRLVRDAGSDRLCGAFFRREDGTIMTRDCPVGLRAMRVRTARMLGRFAACLGVLLTGAAVLGVTDRPGRGIRLRSMQPFATLCEWLAPAPPPPPLVRVPPPGRIVLGVMCESTPSQRQSSTPQ